MRTRLMRGKFTLLFMMLGLLLAVPAIAFAQDVTGSTTPVPGTTPPAPTIQSDQADYPPGGLVTLTGNNWQPGESVRIVVNDDGMLPDQPWQRDVTVTADPSGNITDQFNLPDWFVANYTVTATGTQSGVATTAFTDALLLTASINPTSVATQTSQEFAITVGPQNTSPPGGDLNAQLGCAKITLPTGYTFGSLGTVTAPTGKTWNTTYDSSTRIVTATASNNSSRLQNNLSEKVTFRVTATTPNTTGSTTWTVPTPAGWGQENCSSGGQYALTGSQPSVTITQANNASISGTVYQDSNGNGSLDAGEPGISGVSVSRTGTSSGTTTTNATGVYTFSGLAAGTYSVDYTVPTGYANTGATKPITNISVSAGQTVTGKDFFARKQTSTSLARTAGSSPSTYGNSQTFTATVTSLAGNPNPNNEGSVQFKDGNNTINSCSSVSLTGNTAACTLSNLSFGSHDITAVYSGTTSGNGFAGSTSNLVSQSVDQKAALTVSGITAANKIYDGGTNATLNTSGAQLNGVVSGDQVTLNTSGASGSFANKNVGTGKTVTISGLTISGADAGNYTLTQPTATANITERDLTVDAHGVNKQYDGNADATVTLTTDALSGDEVNVDYTSASFNNKNVGTNKPVSVSGISITGGADAGNYDLTNTTDSTTADITARDLTVDAHGVNKEYDGNASATVTFTDDRLSGDVFTINYTASFNNKNVGTGKPVSVSGISLSGTDAGNYDLTNTTDSTTADITQRSVTGSFTANDKVLDGNTSATIATRSLNSATANSNVGKIAGDDVSLSGGTATFDNSSVGTGKTVTATGFTLSGADGGNYKLEPGPWTTTASILFAPATSTCLGSPGHTILQPINKASELDSTFKQGSTVPAKFRVCDTNGNSIGTPGVVTSFNLVKTISGTESTAVNEEVLSTTPDTAFRWSSTDQQWIFNINTKKLTANKTYVYQITLSDKTTIDFQFGLK